MRVTYDNLGATVFTRELRIVLEVQCSGAVLFTCRADAFYSCYDYIVIRRSGLTNRMYARDDFLPLTQEEVAFLIDVRQELLSRTSDFWDASYAPGPTFTGA